jgi:Tfp pilus assembly protein PilO
VSFKLRNTIVLGVVLFLIAGGGLFYWMYWQPKELDALQAEITKIERQLVNLPSLVQEVETLTAQYQDVRRRYDSRSKEIPQTDISSQTYGYLSQGIDQAGLIKFSFQYNGATNFPNFGYNTYELTDGEAEFENLYKFIYFVENGRRLYKIHEITLTEREEVDQVTKETRKWISFTMILRAYFSKIEELGQSLAATSLTLARTPYDPFNPIVLQAIATDAPVGEIDANNVEVKAVLPGKAFVLLGEELIVLHLGDKVWRGYVSRIVPRESKVEFTVNEGGIVRKIEKRIAFEQQQQQRRRR